jgi:hypothetical protein
VRCEHIEKLRRVTAQSGIALSDAVQEVKILRLGELLRFGNAGREVVPRDHGLDRDERIAAALLGVKQGPTNLPIEPDLVVDCFAGRLKLFLMFILRGIEQLAHNAIVQIDDFVGDGGRSFNRQGNKGGIAALRLELHQIGGSHLAAFSRKLQKSVLMNLALDAEGKIERPQRPETIDMFEDMPRIRLERRLPEPRQRGDTAAFSALE